MAAKRGQPLKFKSAKELQTRIDDYFDHCDNRYRSKFDTSSNKEVAYLWPEPYTVGGLAVWLGTNRQTLINYEERDDYFDIIKTAKARIEHDLEVRAIEARQPAGTIFVLKNGFNWRDESHQTFHGEIKTSSELTPEAAAILAKASRSDGTTKSE
jgi:hypothetical protein